MKYIIAVLLLTIIFEVNSETCVICSSETEPKCVSEAATILGQTCSDPSSSCFIRVDEKGRTIRGCSSELDEPTNKTCADNPNECRHCIAALGVPVCNIDNFPNRRMACHQCTGILNGTAATECAVNSQIPSTICPIYDTEDDCFIHKSVGKNEVVRGCLSSAGDLCKNLTLCFTCEGHGCNFIDAYSERIPDAGNSAIILLNSAAFILFALVLAKFV